MEMQKIMKTPEAYLIEIAKLRAKHEANFKAERWLANDAIRGKIITAWEGYHAAIQRQLDKAGCATGTCTDRHCYSASERIRQLAQSRDYFMAQTEKLRAEITKPASGFDRCVLM